MAQVLFFGYVGLLNMVALAPLLLVLGVAGWVDFAQLSARMFSLVVAKGEEMCQVGMVGTTLWRSGVQLQGMRAVDS